MKLLTRTIRNYLLYSTLLVLVCTPLFYFSIRALVNDTLDRELRSHTEDFFEALPYLKADDDFHFYRLMNEEFVLEKTEHLSNDTLYNQSLYDSTSGTMVPHRIFKKGVIINGAKYNLRIQESTVTSKALISAITGIQLLWLSLLVGGLVLINHRLSKSIWGPFYKILNSLKQYRIDQDDPNIQLSSTAEFRELAAVISQLISKSHSAYLSQKEFTENAAHELQTPLAICRTKLELLAQTKELTHEQADLVVSLLNATDRIARLNKNLLLLSRIENRQFIDVETIDLSPLITKTLETYQHMIDQKGLVIKINKKSTALVKANLALMDMLVTNLIANAIRYSPDGGVVLIDYSSVAVVIKNGGQPLQHPEKLFHRFHRESRTLAGNGLGLSIAKKITEVSGFDLSYSYIDNFHQFAVRMKKMS